MANSWYLPAFVAAGNVLEQGYFFAPKEYQCRNFAFDPWGFLMLEALFRNEKGNSHSDISNHTWSSTERLFLGEFTEKSPHKHGAFLVSETLSDYARQCASQLGFSIEETESGPTLEGIQKLNQKILELTGFPDVFPNATYSALGATTEKIECQLNLKSTTTSFKSPGQYIMEGVLACRVTEIPFKYIRTNSNKDPIGVIFRLDDTTSAMMIKTNYPASTLKDINLLYFGEDVHGGEIIYPSFDIKAAHNLLKYIKGVSIAEALGLKSTGSALFKQKIEFSADLQGFHSKSATIFGISRGIDSLSQERYIFNEPFLCILVEKFKYRSPEYCTPQEILVPLVVAYVKDPKGLSLCNEE